MTNHKSTGLLSTDLQYHNGYSRECKDVVEPHQAIRIL